jgi:hypothetical protein
MTQLMAGMITHAGIALAETPAQSRKRIRRDLQDAILRVLQGLNLGVTSRQTPAINGLGGRFTQIGGTHRMNRPGVSGHFTSFESESESESERHVIIEAVKQLSARVA